VLRHGPDAPLEPGPTGFRAGGSRRAVRPVGAAARPLILGARNLRANARSRRATEKWTTGGARRRRARR
jgi:hypothetical protein